MGRRVFIITAGNKGIGYEVVKKLCTELKEQIKQKQAVVVLAARTMKNGEDAAKKLHSEGHEVEVLELDLISPSSREQFFIDVKNKYGTVECLINNAGFAFKKGATESFAIQSRVTCDINYFGTKEVTLGVVPFLTTGSRIVNVASIMGEEALKEMSDENRIRLMSKHANLDQVDEVVRKFVSDVEAGQLKGWPRTAYGMSKAAVIAMTAVLARMADAGKLKEGVSGIICTCCCPGWCKSDLAGWDKPPLPAEQGALVIVPLALSADKKQQGMFVQKDCIEDLTC